MTTIQKVIKYLAIAFGMALTISIFCLIINISSSIAKGFNVDSKSDKKDNIYQIDKNISYLDVDVEFSNLTIKKGDKFFAESNNKYINIKQDENKLQIKEKKHIKLDGKLDELTIYIPEDLKLDVVNIENGAGTLNIESLTADKLKLSLGAGRVTIDYLDVKSSDIETGAGKFEIKKGNINNLDLDLGVGESSVTSKITGYNEIDTGVSSFKLNLIGSKEDYEITASKGLGNIIIDGKNVVDKQIVGTGENIIKIDGGIGEITVTFNNNNK